MSIEEPVETTMIAEAVRLQQINVWAILEHYEVGLCISILNCLPQTNASSQIWHMSIEGPVETTAIAAAIRPQQIDA